MTDKEVSAKTSSTAATRHGVDDDHLIVENKRPMHREGRTFKKSNSTGSLYLTSTLHAPDISELVKCMAFSALQIMRESKKKPAPPKYPKKVYSVFDDPSSKDSVGFPSPEELARFIKSIVDAGDIAPQSCVLFVIVLDRLRERMALTAQNWRRVVLSSLILGCKVWEDEAVWNSDFEALFPELDNKTLSTLEKQLLLLLGYHVTMKASEYANYFFQMKSMSPTAFDVDEPLSDAEIQRLEGQSAHFEEVARNQKKYSRSVDINGRGHVTTPKRLHSRIKQSKK